MPLQSIKIGDDVILELPNERTMGVIRQIMKGNKIIYAQITKSTMMTYHKYRMNDVVGFRRKSNDFGDTLWVADPLLAYIPNKDPKANKSQAIGE